MDWCRFPVPLILAMFSVTTHSVIYLKAVGSWNLVSLPCIIAEVFFLCVFPKIQLFIKGLVTLACKSALIFLSAKKKGKR